MWKFIIAVPIILAILILIGLIIQKSEEVTERKKALNEYQKIYKEREELKVQISREAEEDKEELLELKNKQAYRKFNVSGVSFDNRQGLILSILEFYGEEGLGNIEFIPEPENEHDPHAIRIVFKDKGTIGYVPKDRSKEIGSLLAKKKYKTRWNIETFYDEEDYRMAYMELRLY